MTAQDSTLIGHALVGEGPGRVVVLNDWLCDTSTWDPLKPYLDTSAFTFAFADLRGYGRSRELSGDYTLQEAQADVVRVTQALGWERFSLVGHSMSTLIAFRIAQLHPERVSALVALTPPPPAGFGADEQVLQHLRQLALGTDEERTQLLAPQFGDRLTPMWMGHKLRRWRETAEPKAVAGYCTLFARDGLPDLQTTIAAPVLAITGEQDGPPMRAAAVSEALSSLCPRLTVTPIELSGHYPMQETPPLTATLVQRFLAEQGTS